LIGDEPEPPIREWHSLPAQWQIDEAGTYLARRRSLPASTDLIARRSCTGRGHRARKVALDGGSELGFDSFADRDRVVPARLPVPGADLAGVNPCWTLADARRIMERAGPSAACWQIGAGSIGCIILEALANRGVSLTWWKWAIGWCRA